MTITEQVRRILADEVSTRNSDTALYIEYLQRNGMGLSLSQREKLWNLAAPETIRRVRQKLQEKGMYLADEKVRRGRSHKSMVMSQAAPAYNAQNIERTLHRTILPWGKGR